MADYVIKADSGYDSIPVSDFGEQTLDFNNASFVEIEIPAGGTSTEPKSLWESTGGYVRKYGSGNNIQLPYKTMNGSLETGSGIAGPATESMNLYVCSIMILESNIYYLYVYFTYATNAEGAAHNLNNYHSVGSILYRNRLDLSDNILEVDREWDETPTEDIDDPNNLLPNGGAFADLGAFDETYLMSDIPDPEDMEPVDTGGLVCCYSLDSGDLATLNSCLFTPDFWTSLANKFSGLSDPLSMILKCIELPLTPARGAIPVAKIGGVEIMTPSEGGTSHSITLPCPAKRFGRYYIGNVLIKETWGSAKDYNAVSVSIFLPYIGIKELDPDIVIDAWMYLYCYVDYWTGDILYILKTGNDLRPKKYYVQESVVYRWSGNCARDLPVGRFDNTGAVLHTASSIAGLIGMIAGGGAGAAAAASVPQENISIGGGIGNPLKGANSFVNGFAHTMQTSGGIAGNVGSMDYQYPYIIIKRGVPEYPNNWRGQIGAPRNQTFKVSDLTGYTLFDEIQLADMGNAIEEEKAELERILTTEGVIL